LFGGGGCGRGSQWTTLGILLFNANLLLITPVERTRAREWAVLFTCAHAHTSFEHSTFQTQYELIALGRVDDRLWIDTPAIVLSRADNCNENAIYVHQLSYNQ
jgi:hypothetical protein